MSARYVQPAYPSHSTSHFEYVGTTDLSSVRCRGHALPSCSTPLAAVQTGAAAHDRGGFTPPARAYERYLATCLSSRLFRAAQGQQDGTLEAPPSWRALYLTKQQQTEEAKALATARIKGRYAEHSAQKDAKKLVVSNVPIPTHRRARRPAPSRPSTPYESKGRSMLLKARTGLAMRTRQMMRPRGLRPPRRTPPSSRP